MTWKYHQSKWSNQPELTTSPQAGNLEFPLYWHSIYYDMALYEYHYNAPATSWWLTEYFQDPWNPTSSERDCFNMERGVEYPPQHLLNELKEGIKE